MSVEAVFKSQHPDVIALSEAFTTGAVAQREYAADLEARYGREVLRRGGMFGLTVVGLSPSEDDNRRAAPRTRPDMPGWRLGAKEGYWVPDKRTEAGRALAAEFKSRRVKKPVYPGMPEEVWADSPNAFQTHIHTPGSQLIDGAVWVTWSCGADRLIEGRTDDGAQRTEAVDLDIWTHVRLSEYHAMIEAHDDALADA